jgi:hypothetical protein
VTAWVASLITHTQVGLQFIEGTWICVFQSAFEETSDQRSSVSIHRVLPFSSVQRFHSGGALFFTEGLGGGLRR